MDALPVWAGVICHDISRAVPWYVDRLGCRLAEEGPRWALVVFGDGSGFELHQGIKEAPGLTFPSYGSDPGPPVLPGYSVQDPELVAESCEIARRLPDWIVVVAPDGLRVVLTSRESDPGVGLVGFRFASPDPDQQADFLSGLAVNDPVVRGEAAWATPIVRGSADEVVCDPDGTEIAIVRDGPA